MKRLKKTLVAALALYFAVLAGAYFFQEQLIYNAGQGSEPEMLARAEKLHLRPWRIEGRLVGWARPKPDAKKRMLVFHGNSGSALDRERFVAAFERWEVWIAEHPGFGSRPGPLTMENLIAAGTAAFDDLAKRDARPVVILGESVGSGVACALAGQRPGRTDGVVALIPFTRMEDVINARFPFLLPRVILRHTYDNSSALQPFSGRLAVIIAENDEVVTPQQGRKLFEGHRLEKRLWALPGSRHGNYPLIPGSSWVSEVMAFMEG